MSNVLLRQQVRLAMTAPFRSSISSTYRHIGRAIGSTLSYLSTLPRDSREPLLSKDTQWASFGMNWTTDISHETELARELQAAHEQRLARSTPGPINKVADSSPTRSPLALSHAKWTRSMRHRQGSPRPVE